MLVASMLNTF